MAKLKIIFPIPTCFGNYDYQKTTEVHFGISKNLTSVVFLVITNDSLLIITLDVCFLEKNKKGIFFLPFSYVLP